MPSCIAITHTDAIGARSLPNVGRRDYHRAPMDVADLASAVYQEGFAGLPGAFSRDWGLQLRDDFDVLYAEARAFEGGTVSRGPNRHYFAVHPERLTGFVDLVTHPTVVRLCEHVLGDEYQVVEVAFDVPLPGAV